MKTGAGADLEARQLRYLATHTAIPVPEVVHVDDTRLVMTYIAADGAITRRAEEDAGRKLAALHAITAPAFGFDFDTPIGGLIQPNSALDSWRDFFRDRRVMHMAREALAAGRLPPALFARIEKLCGRLDHWIGAASTPSLIHGDLWTGNVLVKEDRLVGAIDPALAFADAEIELAFTTLFGTFGEAFFKSYGELRPIAPGFFEERRDLYNLYPLLVHVRLFGGSYVAQVERALAKFGC
jgi:fructosamine-3-kinase